MSEQRLQKVLAKADFGSRRKAEELIVQQRVSVNGKVANIGQKVETDSDLVEVDGVVIIVNPSLVYYLLNKPKGVICTSSDTHQRPTVIDLVPLDPRVFSVGRLDSDTEGLLIMTNDGELSFRLTHPSFGVEKEYLAQVEASIGQKTIKALKQGVELQDGLTAPAKVTALSLDVLKISIHEGKNRQIRRMCEAVGHPVKRLVRTRIGPISDSKLSPGQFRILSQREIRSLYATTKLKVK